MHHNFLLSLLCCYLLLFHLADEVLSKLQSLVQRSSSRKNILQFPDGMSKATMMTQVNGERAAIGQVRDEAKNFLANLPTTPGSFKVLVCMCMHKFTVCVVRV